MTDTSTSVLRFAEEIHVTDFNCVVCMEPMIGKKVFQCCKGEHNSSNTTLLTNYSKAVCGSSKDRKTTTQQGVA